MLIQIHPEKWIDAGKRICAGKVKCVPDSPQTSKARAARLIKEAMEDEGEAEPKEDDECDDGGGKQGAVDQGIGREHVLEKKVKRATKVGIERKALRREMQELQAQERNASRMA